MGRTGRYRVRRDWRGRAILQEEFSWPAIIGGFPDASLREIEWCDVKFDRLANIAFTPLPKESE